MHFQGAFAVSFREGSGNMYLRKDLLAFLQFDLEVGLTNVNIIEIVATQKDLTVLTPNRAMFQNRLQYKMMMYILHFNIASNCMCQKHAAGIYGLAIRSAVGWDWLLLRLVKRAHEALCDDKRHRVLLWPWRDAGCEAEQFLFYIYHRLPFSLMEVFSKTILRPYSLYA